MSSISAGTTSTTTLIHSGDTTGSLVFKTNDTGSGGTTAVTIDTSQNVGIGVTPSAWSGGKAIEIGNAGNSFWNFGVAENHLTTNAYYNAGWKFGGTGYANKITTSAGVTSFNVSSASGTAGGAVTFNESMRIDSSGNLLVGTTSNNPAGRANSSKFVVSQTAGDTSTFVQNSNSYVNMVSWVNTTSATRYHISFGDGSTYGERGVISTNGTGTTYGTNSDYRLKENIAPMTGALSVVAKLKPVTYKWKSDGSDGQGFIAHELQAVVPECVVGEKDAVDENGNPKYQGIDTSFLVATLTAAIQEQQALITAQAETINALTARVVALESRGTV